MEKYSYVKTVQSSQLASEISKSAIITALDRIDTNGDAVDIYMKAALSAGDETILASLVSDHVPVPITDQPQQVVVTSTPAFAAKTLGTKSLFKRVVGKSFDVVLGDNNLTYTLTFPWAKFMALEIVNGEIGDTVSLYVLDTNTGTFSGYPNAPLNQFGFSANIGKEFYCHKSEFDADIYAGLQVQLIYNSVSPKKIGVNFVLNEVK